MNNCLHYFPVHPGAPHNLTVTEVKARSVLLNFIPGPSGRAPILTYTVEYNNDSSYDPASARWWTLMVVTDAHLFWKLLPLKLAHLKPCTFYRFRVIAANKIDSSSPSNPSDKIKTLTRNWWVNPFWEGNCGAITIMLKCWENVFAIHWTGSIGGFYLFQDYYFNRAIYKFSDVLNCFSVFYFHLSK